MVQWCLVVIVKDVLVLYKYLPKKLEGEGGVGGRGKTSNIELKAKQSS